MTFQGDRSDKPMSPFVNIVDDYLLYNFGIYSEVQTKNLETKLLEVVLTALCVPRRLAPTRTASCPWGPNAEAAGQPRGRAGALGRALSLAPPSAGGLKAPCVATPVFEPPPCRATFPRDAPSRSPPRHTPKNSLSPSLGYKTAPTASHACRAAARHCRRPPLKAAGRAPPPGSRACRLTLSSPPCCHSASFHVARRPAEPTSSPGIKFLRSSTPGAAVPARRRRPRSVSGPKSSRGELLLPSDLFPGQGHRRNSRHPHRRPPQGPHCEVQFVSRDFNAN
jgi:hypothetical protein